MKFRNYLWIALPLLFASIFAPVIGAVTIAAAQAAEKSDAATETPVVQGNVFAADGKDISIRGSFVLAPDGTPISVEGTWYIQDTAFGGFTLARNQLSAKSIPVPPGRGTVRLDPAKRLLLFEACSYDTTQLPPNWICAPWMEIPLEVFVVVEEEDEEENVHEEDDEETTE